MATVLPAPMEASVTRRTPAFCTGVAVALPSMKTAACTPACTS